MNILISFLCMVLSSIAFSQTDKVNNNTPSKFRIGIIAQPNLAYRKLGRKKGWLSDEYADWLIEYWNEKDIPKFGYLVGLNTEFKISEHFTLESGINYSNKGYRTKNITALSESTYPYFKYHYSSHCFDIPLMLNYSLGKNKLKLTSSIGFSVTILIKSIEQKIFMNSDGFEEVTSSYLTNENRTFNLTPTISLGAEYQVNTKTSIKVQPTFNYNILKNIDWPHNTYLWSTGVQFGYYIGF